MEKFFSSENKMTSPPFAPTSPCTGATGTQAGCLNSPNTTWIGTPTSGTCFCCRTDGTTYANVGATGVSSACIFCASNPACGSGNGFCKSSSPSCVQDATTKKYSCAAGATCGNGCSGSCGLGEWFAFQACNQSSDGSPSCGGDIGQWKSWLTYGLIILFVILFIIFIIYITRRGPTTTVAPPSAPSVVFVSPPAVPATAAYTSPSPVKP